MTGPVAPDLYRALLNDASAALQRGAVPDLRVGRVLLGINWTALQTELSSAIGLAFSPQDVPRTLPWPGTLCGRPVRELMHWVERWNPAEAAVGLAALNAVINQSGLPISDSPLPDSPQVTAQILTGIAPPHLRVFEHFTPQVADARVVVVGRYPGLDELWRGIPYQCLERKPQAGDLPDTAAEFCLPQADWVFITASSIANKSVLRLLQLSRHARVVLMGPSLPWWPRWHEFGVDYLAGVRVTDPSALWQVVAEGGGTRLFDAAVQYGLHAF